MRILVTGGSGFIGSHVCRVLLASGCEVAILVRPRSSLWRLEDVLDRLVVNRLESWDGPSLRAALGDLRPEACIHLAWHAIPGEYLHAAENVPSLVATLALLEELIRSGCRRVVMAGTCAEYDTRDGYLREDRPAQPATLYAATKLAANLIGQRIAADAGITFAWGRIFYLYGPFENQRRLVPAVIRSLTRGEAFQATSGLRVRDYLHVHDVAGAFWAILSSGVSGVVNIASGVPVTVRQMLETVGDIMGRAKLLRFGEAPLKAWEPPFICGDNARLRTETSWSPAYPTLRSGLEQTVEWWQARGFP